MAAFKLSCNLAGHSLDVRGVAVCNDGSIVSGSRDATAKLWKPNGLNPGFHEAQTFRGHTNFVTCVAYCPPTPDYPNGLVMTGSNDKNICGFVAEQGMPVLTLKGHLETVCCLHSGLDPGIVLSSSWDKTARIWNVTKRSTEVTLKGHEMAVWCVIQLSGNLVITGSADKSLKLWSRSSGECKATLTGHTDCVRGLAKLSEVEFLSSANDACVRHWSTSGDCIGTYYGHSNYIYSVAASLTGFVSVGEDSTLRIWEGGKCIQTLSLPAESVWTVAVLSNGDLATGSSDGMVRIFSQNPERQAAEDVLKAFDAEVEAMFKASTQELGDVKISDLSGREALFEPGRSDGQTKLIREGASVMCYSWSAELKEWTKVGDVTGAVGGTQKTSGKTLFNGKEYDFVFSIDIQDGVPPLKLPYNASEDPWFVAQKFIHDNNLPQAYLEQVANFIVDNSKSAVAPVTAPPSDYIDPFTGGSRYIPSGGQPVVNNASAAPGYDPFTGGNRYVPQASQINKKVEAVPKSHFPQKVYLRFDQANLRAMLEKLQELNRKTGDGGSYVDENALPGIVKLVDPDGSFDVSSLSSLQLLLEWPQDIVFPVLDVTRLAVRHEVVNRALCEGSAGTRLFSMLQSFLQPAPGPNQMLALRILSNMLSHSYGEELVAANVSSILLRLKQYRPPFTKPLEVAIATLLLNISVLFTQKTSNPKNVDDTGIVCSEILPQLSDKEATYRALVAVGTLLTQKTDCLPKWAENLVPFIISLTESEDDRIRSCAQQLVDLSS